MLKLKIVRPLGDSETRICSERPSDPISLWFNPPAPQPVTERNLEYLRKVLAYPTSIRAKYLGPLIGTADELATRALIERGNDYVVNYYVEWERAKRQASWESEKQQRQSSLMYWGFRNKLVKVEGWETASREELVTRVKHKVLSEEKAFHKLKREIELFEKIETASPLRREPIPEDVRLFVWRRDEGRCVRCGSQERIEFDHIIPLDKGGSNTVRNLQVLCERCNREKGTNV